jgi:tRNA A-37 threonylcarbamoyl transferase component Bud32
VKYCDTCRSSYPADFATCPKDQTALRLVTDLTPGLVLRGKYEILEKIGAGGMGAVYKARHLAFGELRAIKFVNTQLIADQEYLARFRSEAVLARRLQHPNAVRVEDLDATEDGRPFIVMEYVEGRSLRKVLRDEGAMPVERAVEIARQTCAALDAAHAIGIVHRDIKPDNIVLVQKDGKDVAKVLDFGLAKILEGFEGQAGQVSTLTGMVVGTPQYMSPEQGMASKSAPPDGRADLYALGVVLYEMLTGRLPFYSDSPVGLILKHVQVQPIPPHELAPDRGIPEDLSAILMKTLAKDREDRYSTAGHMAAALSAYNLPTLQAAAPTGEQEAPTAGVSRPVGAPTARPAAPTAPAAPALRKATHTPTAATAVPAARPRPPASRPAPAPVVEAEEPSSGSGLMPWVLGAAAVIAIVVVMTRRDTPKVVASPSPLADTGPAAVPPPVAGGVAVSQDDAILTAVNDVFFRSSGLRDARLNAEVTNGIVTLSGDAPSQAVLDLAVSLARSVRGVRQVFAHTVQVAGAQGAPAPAAAETTAPAPPPAAAAAPAPPAESEQVRSLLEQARREIESDNPEAAEKLVEEALRIAPDHRLAREMLQKLKSRPPHPGPRGPRRPGS